MAERPTHPPGHPAPATATYEQINVFGSPTGIVAHVPHGHPLPPAPVGHGWAIGQERSEDC